MSSRHLSIVAARHISIHADAIGFSVAVFLLCCLGQSVTAQLSFTVLGAVILLFDLRSRKKLLPVATKQYIRQVVSKSVLSAHRALWNSISWVR